MNNEVLRHILSTMAYRIQKVVEYSKSNFGDYAISENTRTPNEILHHINDVLNKTKIFVETEKFDKSNQSKLEFRGEIKRFYELLQEFDAILKNKLLDVEFCKKLVQGPLSDIFCHIGQISMLCGMSGNKIPGEDYSSAKIITGEFNSKYV